MKDYNKALEYEIFQKEEYGCVKENIKHADIIFDIGGHIGLFSERCLSLNPQAYIHYFEPFEVLVAQAKERLKKYHTHITYNSFGIAKEEGSQTFFFNSEKTMQSSSKQSFLNPKGEEQTVLCKNLNNYIKQNGIDKIDLMKIDIEGMEFEVLENLEEENWEKIGTLVCEIHLFTPEMQESFLKLKKLFDKYFRYNERIPSPYTDKIGIFCAKRGKC